MTSFPETAKSGIKPLVLDLLVVSSTALVEHLYCTLYVLDDVIGQHLRKFGFLADARFYNTQLFLIVFSLLGLATAYFFLRVLSPGGGHMSVFGQDNWGCIRTTDYSKCTSKHPDSVYLLPRCTKLFTKPS